MTEDRLRMLDAVTDARIKAVSFDMEIASDHLKYASWSAALATAGVALIITKRDVIKSTFFVDAIVRYGIVAAGVILAISVAVAGYIHRRVNRELDAERHAMTLTLKQRVLVLGGSLRRSYASEPDNLLDFAQAVMDHDYLSVWDKENLEKYVASARKPEELEPVVLLQIGLIGIGYGILLLVGV